MKKYKDEFAKFGGVTDDDLVKKSDEVSNSCSRTTFEAQLVRSLKKDTVAERNKGVLKYKGIYANVPPASVEPLLWAECEKAK